MTANSLQNKSKYEHLNICVDHDEDEPLHCELVENQGKVMFSKILRDSPFYGKVQPKDYCVSINKKKVNDKNELFKIAMKSDPNIDLVIARPKNSSKHNPESSSSKKSQKRDVIPVKSSAKQTTASPAKQTKDTLLETPSTSDSSPSSKSEKSEKSEKEEIVDPKALAIAKGFQVAPDKEYLLFNVKSLGAGKPLGLGILRVTNQNLTVVSSVQANSISVEMFKIGDRFLIINDTVIKDVEACKKIIMESRGDFTALIERPPKGLKAYGIMPKPVLPPLKCSYTNPNPNNPEEVLGDPLIDYETAPADVRAFLERQIPILMKAFRVGSQKSWGKKKTINDKRIKIDHDIHKNAIESDVAADFQLRKVPKRY